MKVILITAVAAYLEDLKKILRNSKIETYTFQEVIGYRDTTLDAISSNWFASEHNERASILCHVFAESAKAFELAKNIEHFNQEQEVQSKIHYNILANEQFNH
ncbi:MAG: hypothetical protein ACK4K1_10430 [Flavobacterium sp.]